MNYVVYGAGYRGKRVLDYIGEKSVCAFIDIDVTKQGTEYCGKPVISLDEYIIKYESCFIIISPAFSNDIEEILEKRNIYQYCNLIDMPSEFVGYGESTFEECYGKLEGVCDSKVCIYGVNALGFLIYDLLCQRKDTFICMEDGSRPEKLQWLKKFFPEVKLKEYVDIQNDETLLIGIAVQKNISNKMINLFEYASNNILYRNEKILKFKQYYKKNKKCFLVATGPSLKIDDLFVLKESNIFCFGVNSILKIKDKWVPDAYVASDSNFISNNADAIKDYNCNLKFIGDSCKEYWEEAREDSYKIHVTTSGKKIDFSSEIEQKIYGGYGGMGTVTYVCIQLAVYMGFSEIYLLGVDCNYVMGSKNNHFIEDDVEDNRNHREDSMIKAYKYAKEYTDMQNIKIFNATRGGMLEVFERVDFDAIDL